MSSSYKEAMKKAFLGAGVNLPNHRKMVISVKDQDKHEIVSLARRFRALGYTIYATKGTYMVLKQNGISAERVNKIDGPSPNLMDLILGHELDLIIDTPKYGAHRGHGYLIRRLAVETGVQVLTAVDTAGALLTSMEAGSTGMEPVDIAKI